MFTRGHVVRKCSKHVALCDSHRLWPTIIATVESTRNLKAERSIGPGDGPPRLLIHPSVDSTVSDARGTVRLSSVCIFNLSSCLIFSSFILVLHFNVEQSVRSLAQTCQEYWEYKQKYLEVDNLVITDESNGRFSII